MNELQDDWDISLPQLSYAYNSSIHGTTNFTPFEAMFGRKPKLPIDLLYPPVEPDRRVAGNQDLGADAEREVDRLKEFTPKLEPDAEEHVNNLKKYLAHIGRLLVKSRDIRMERAKCLYDRRIKKEFYKLGDKVLVNHPKLTKGQKQGIAYKYHGPYTVVGVNSNLCNYTIRKEKKGARAKQVHKNNLKAFFERGTDLNSEPKYRDKGTNTDATLSKNRTTPNKAKDTRENQSTSDPSACETSDTGKDTTEEQDKIKSPVKQKRKYTKRSIPAKPTVSRSGRILKNVIATPLS